MDSSTHRILFKTGTPNGGVPLPTYSWIDPCCFWSPPPTTAEQTVTVGNRPIQPATPFLAPPVVLSLQLRQNMLLSWEPNLNPDSQPRCLWAHLSLIDLRLGKSRMWWALVVVDMARYPYV